MSKLREFFERKSAAIDKDASVDDLVAEFRKLIREDKETYYAYHALFEFKIMPWDFVNLPPEEKAMTIACIEQILSERENTNE